jgi:hypothetical protein
MAMPKDNVNPFVKGHLIIRDKHTGQILADSPNAIHNGNMANALAESLAGLTTAHLKYMVFGNGGTQIDATGAIAYKPANVSDIKDETAALYNETYKKDVSVNDAENFIEVVESTSNYTDIVVTCTLTYGEPADQDASDGSDTNPASFDSDYVFDEIALYSAGEVGSPYGLMLTHVLFHPVKKAANREIEIEYSLRIQVN